MNYRTLSFNLVNFMPLEILLIYLLKSIDMCVTYRYACRKNMLHKKIQQLFVKKAHCEKHMIPAEYVVKYKVSDDSERL